MQGEEASLVRQPHSISEFRENHVPKLDKTKKRVGTITLEDL